MGYEVYRVGDLRLAKIVQNAKKFDVPAMQNEALLKAFLGAERLNLSQLERENLEQIFVNLIKIEQSVQLSKN